MYYPTETWRKLVTPAITRDIDTSNYPYEKTYCALTEFFKNEQAKPPHLRCQSANLYYPCPMCNPVCM